MEKLTKQEKAEIKQECKSFNEMISRATEKGALVNDSDIGYPDDPKPNPVNAEGAEDPEEL